MYAIRSYYDIARENVVYMLNKEKHYHIESAADGEEAIALIEQNEYDLVLTDLKMKT